VERVLSMVDGVLLLVDAVEGPMPQTRFVTRKALAQGLKPIVIVNKVDRDGARPDWVVDQTFDLMDKLGASEDQLDFPVIYASALQGWASVSTAGAGGGAAKDAPAGNMQPLFEAILQHVPEPKGDVLEDRLEEGLHVPCGRILRRAATRPRRGDGRPSLQRRGVDHGKVELVLARAELVHEVERLVDHPVGPGAVAIDLVHDDDGLQSLGERLA